MNPDDVLSKINALNIQQWNYIKEDSSVRHIGPIAEDFYAAFNLGGSDRSISTIDPAGVALIGIQALSKRLDSIQGPTLFDSLSVNLATSTPEETSSWNNIFTALKNFGAEIIDGIAYLKNVFIEKLTVNTVKVQKGIEMKSPDGTTYCVTIDNNGEFQKDRGDCDAPDPVAPTVSTGGGSSDTGTPATTPTPDTVTASSTDSTTPPPAEVTPPAPDPVSDVVVPAPAPEPTPEPAPAPVSEPTPPPTE